MRTAMIHEAVTETRKSATLTGRYSPEVAFRACLKVGMSRYDASRFARVVANLATGF